MIPCLNPATTGGSKNLEEFIAVAGKHCFGGIDYDIARIAEVVEQKSADTVRELFATAGVQLASFGLPVEFRKDKAKFEEQLPHLPRLAAAATSAALDRRACRGIHLPGRPSAPRMCKNPWGQRNSVWPGMGRPRHRSHPSTRLHPHPRRGPGPDRCHRSAQCRTPLR